MSLFTTHPLPWSRSGAYLNRVVDANGVSVVTPIDMLSPVDEQAQLCNLIAASPELVSALVRLLREHDCITIANGGKPGVSDRWPDAAGAARAALIKAGYREAIPS
jgi:hypothetical protein